MVILRPDVPAGYRAWMKKTTKEWKEKSHKKMKRKKLQTIYMIQLSGGGSLFKHVNLSINKQLSLFKAVLRLGDFL